MHTTVDRLNRFAADLPDPFRLRPAARRLAIVAAFAVVALLGTAGCGSEQKGNRTPNELQQVEDPKDLGATDASFCAVVEDVRKAQEAGDPSAMASTLQLVVDDLPDEVADDVQAYIDGLQAAPPNDEPSPDSEENPEAERAYRAYAEQRCGTTGAGDRDGGSSTSEVTTTVPSG
ncbi:MAG: hypothetical protein JWM47_3644 [Acidimicrobiales bacterium]|nr:hypothetical protein [Acidimicrobiales bacterium]